MKKINIPKVSINDFKIWISSVDRKTLIQNTTVGAVFLIFLLFLFLPLVIQNQRSAGKVRQLKNKIVQASVKIARIPEWTKQKELFGARIKLIREQFFEAKESDQLIQIISTAAAEAGVKISASRPSTKSLEVPAPFAQLYMIQSYELLVEGPYHNLGTFVNKLEQYSKNLALHDLYIVKGSKAPNIQECTVTLSAFLKRSE